MNLGEKIPALLKLRGLNQAELARAVGLPPQRISEWVSDRRTPGLRHALRVARALDVPLDYLADDEADEPPARRQTERERRIWEVIATIGEDEAWRRLVGAPGDGAAQGGKPPLSPGDLHYSAGPGVPADQRKGRAG